MPFIASQLVDTIEIHDFSTLKIVQKIVFNAPIISIFCVSKKEEDDRNYLNSNGDSGNSSMINSSYNSSDKLNEINENNFQSNFINNYENNNNNNNNVNSNEVNNNYSNNVRRNVHSVHTNDYDSTMQLQHICVSTVGRSADSLYVLRMNPILNQVIASNQIWYYIHYF